MVKRKLIKPIHQYVPLKELNILKRFSILAFLPIMIVVLALGFILTNMLTNDMISGEVSHTTIQTTLFAKKFLTEDDFNKDMLIEKRNFDSAFLPILKTSDEYKRIKAYDSEGTVLWSDKKELIGINFFKSNEDLRKALSGEIVQKFGQFSKEEHTYEREFKKGLEVYIPIFISGKLVGVIETYRVPLHLFKNIKKTYMAVWILSVLCGGIIYISLYWLVKSSYENQAALEKNLTLSNSRLFHLIDGLRDGVALIDPDCNILTINRTLAESFNVPLKKSIGENVSDLFFKSAQEKMYAACGDTCIRNLESSFDFVITERETNKKRYFKVKCIPLSSLNEKLSNSDIATHHAVIVLREITREKDLTEELIRSEKLATIGTLFPKISHEIKSPLNALELGLVSIQEKYPNENVLDLLLSAKEKLINIANDLLAFSRVRDEQFTVLNINDVISNAVIFLKDTTGQIKYHKILEDYKGGCYIKGIYGKLEQMFINLIVNASHSMEKKPSSEQVLSIGTYIEGENVIVYVKDTGIGIREEDYDNIFDPFFTTKVEGRGTGLGMAIVKEIAATHKAKITFESDLEKGTTFFIRFKCVEPDQAGS
jgi:signal transduction histidine kinase